MNRELQTRIVGTLRQYGHLVDAMLLELEPSSDDLMEDNARLERIVKDLNDANRVLFESQREAAESADEKPDGQAENASRVGPPTNTSTNKTDV